MWNGTIATDLNTFLDASVGESGWYMATADAINDSGWITGRAANRLTGEQRGYLFAVSAVPEPTTYALFIAGLAALRIRALRRKTLPSWPAEVAQTQRAAVCVSS